jgi:hypothetical protein
MTNGAMVRAALVVILSAFTLSNPASAQNAVGGPKKQIAVGGAAKQNSPVVPANKGGSTAVSSPSKCPSGSCVAKGHK